MWQLYFTLQTIDFSSVVLWYDIYNGFNILKEYGKISSVQWLSHVDSATPWTVPCQDSLSITNSWSLLKLKSIELVMPSNCLIVCHPLLFLPSFFPSIRVFSNESVLPIRWPKYWGFSFSTSPSSGSSGLISAPSLIHQRSESEVAQSCLTLSDPMDCSQPGPSVHGIFQARVLEWGAIAFS